MARIVLNRLWAMLIWFFRLFPSLGCTRLEHPIVINHISSHVNWLLGKLKTKQELYPRRIMIANTLSTNDLWSKNRNKDNIALFY